MACLNTSHASIGNSTLKDARDLTSSSVGGPEDFTLNLVDLLKLNKPSFKHTNERQLSPAPFGGPEDFTLNLADHLRPNKPIFNNTNKEHFSTSSFGGPEDFTADIANYANRAEAVDSSQPSKGRVIAPLRRASKKTSDCLPSHPPSHSPTYSPDHNIVAVYPTEATKSGGPSLSRRPSTPRSKTSTSSVLIKPRSSKKLVSEPSDRAALDDNGTVSIIIKDGNIYRKTVRAGLRKKMQPTVSDEDDEEDHLYKDDPTDSLLSSPRQQKPSEPSMSLPLPLPEDDLTKPVCESTPTQHTLDSDSESTTSSKDSPFEEGFDFATSLAHRIQHTPASAKKPAEYSINLSAEVSQRLAEGVPRPVLFPRNDSFVRNCSDRNVAFADRIRGIRPAKVATAHHSPEPSKVDEAELLRQQLEQMKAALAQKDETINVLHYKLSAKEAECEGLHNALHTKLSAKDAEYQELHNVFQNQISAKDTECEELHNAFQAQFSAKEAECEDLHNAFQTQITAKEAECEGLYNALHTKSTTLTADAESREIALQDAVRAAEEETAIAVSTAAERFAIVKHALIAAEDEAVVAAAQAKDAVAAAETKADDALSRCRRLEKEVTDLTASARKARKEHAERDALWVQRSDILLAECDRRGRALMLKIGEHELPGVKDEKGRQAYRYQRETKKENGVRADRGSYRGMR